MHNHKSCDTLETMEKTTERLDSKVYEIGYILLSSIPEEKVSSEVDSLKAMLVKRNAAIIAEGAPTLKTLAYTMVKKIGSVNRRFNQGYFGWIKFETSAEDVELINKELRETESVLRFILISTIRDHMLVSEKLALEAEEAAAQEAQDAESTETTPDVVAEKPADDLSV